VSAQAEYLDEDVDDYDEEISEPEAKALLENGDVEVEEVDEDLEAPEEVKKSPPPSVSRDASPASAVEARSATPTEKKPSYLVQIGQKCGQTCIITAVIAGTISTILFGILMGAIIVVIAKSRQPRVVIKPDVHESWI
jgi:hypothetical protein